MNNGNFGSQNPFGGNQNQQNSPQATSEMKEFSSARRLTLAANIMGPVSLFIGGTLLSSIGLICAILGFHKLRSLSISGGSMASSAQMAQRATKMSIGICLVALVLNVISVIIIFPEMLELVQSGNMSGLGGSPAGSSGTSTWG